MFMKLFAAAIAFAGLSSFAQADTTCRTNSNGYSFSKTRRDYTDARQDVTRACRQNHRTSDYECNMNVRCTNHGGGSHGNPPPVGSDRCWISQTREWVDGDRFFSLVSQWARENRTCAVAKIAFLPSSGRIYDTDGSRVAKERGGMSNSEVDHVLRTHGLYGCERYTCHERN